MKPEKVDGQLAQRTYYYKDQIRRLIKGCFEVDCPDYINRDYVLNTLLFKGYFIVTDTSAGMQVIWPSLTDQNFMQLPTRATAELPFLKPIDRQINVDCVLYNLEYMFRGWWFNFREVVDVLSQRLASCDGGIDVNIFNSKTAYAYVAEDKAEAATIKAAYDKISNGEPIVITKSNLISSQGTQMFFNNIKNNYVANDMQDTKRSIINELLTYLGINNSNTDKKERLITGEVDSNNEELEANVDVWKQNLEISNKLTKQIFPDFPFSIKYKYGKVRESNKEMAGGKNDIQQRS